MRNRNELQVVSHLDPHNMNFYCELRESLISMSFTLISLIPDYSYNLNDLKVSSFRAFIDCAGNSRWDQVSLRAR
jgi:hypothetical protein